MAQRRKTSTGDGGTRGGTRVVVGPVSKRQTDEEQLQMDVATLDDEFDSEADIAAEVSLLSANPVPGTLPYVGHPVNGKELFSGIVVGAAAVMVPGLRDVENGTAALSTLQQCFDPRSLYETYYIDNLFGGQESEDELTDADIDEFAAFAVSVNETDDRSVLDKAIDSLVTLPVRTWKVWSYLSAVLRKMAPYFIKIIGHAATCGYLDFVVGWAFSLLIAVFPPLLILLLPVGVVALAAELIVQVKAMVASWKRDWFAFGKATGTLAALVAAMVIAYKKSQDHDDAFQCKERGKGCSYEMPEECNPAASKCARRFSSTSSHCPSGNTCNKVLQSDELIDPNFVDTKGRTNIQRMKSGLAPIGPDGKSVNLHHVTQDPDGVIAELSATYHKQQHGELHTFLKPGEGSRINRELFDSWRTSYWRSRGASIEAALGMGMTWSFVRLAPSAIAALIKTTNTGELLDGDENTANVTRLDDILDAIVDVVVGGDEDGELADEGEEVGASAYEGLGYLDVLRWAIASVKGRIIDLAEDFQENADALKAAGLAQRSSLRKRGKRSAPLTGTDGVVCAWDAQCTAPISVNASMFDGMDAQLDRSLAQDFVVQYDAAALAMSLRVGVTSGTADVQLLKDGAGSSIYALVSSPGRETGKSLEEPTAGLSSSRTELTVAVHQCDGPGAYALHVAGTSEPDPANVASDDPDWAAFWSANGSMPDDRVTEFSIATQYVKYPVVDEADGHVSVTAVSGTEVELAWPEVTDSGIDEDDARDVVYTVFYTTDKAVADDVTTVCDVLKGLSYAGRTTLRSTSTITLTVAGLQAFEEYTFFVLASNSGGASSLYGASRTVETSSASTLTSAASVALAAVTAGQFY